ncbi:unnamed protein product [Kuraishia capsulata CBS 1993]|uniref:DNA mismatch repair protein S5 domain-containing protein n=1 Tax=Kuraishia capsulata CBS 1993 TaxID=1382522 RepID=W6MWH9_9ASCO|nr:uncharacterized protein KUCA_T00003453001 [Kuraishia capsulata CBS 1993]CDK27475.1 unnamed protein product [Kuraishia capsulata CBS 1993]
MATKISTSPLTMTGTDPETRRIRPLAASVVNRIAAGEIIIGPSNALKELLENAIDANSTSVEVQVKEGGLKILQITDNGSGINKEDLPILCERFTTSKLEKFEDLDSIATYGFRGEALASISHIAHLSVVTKTRASACAWKCTYSDGRLVAPKPKESSDPKPTAGKDGTQITVEDLFFNVPSRLRAIRSPGEEYAKILDVVGRYAIHTEGVSLSCKKIGDTFASVSTRNSQNIKDRIRAVFGATVANNIMEISIAGLEQAGLRKCIGQITNSNYTNKKVIAPVFFINGRLVACDPLKRAIFELYSAFLPKGQRPFIYLSLEIDPANVDVNVHPTKREVRFLYEEEIFQHICSSIQEKLSGLDSTRTFLTQQVLHNSKRQGSDISEIVDQPTRVRSISQLQEFKRRDNKLVRTDESQEKITSFLNRSQVNSQVSSRLNRRGDTNIDQSSIDLVEGVIEVSEADVLPTTDLLVNDRERIGVKLTSVMELRKEVESKTHSELTEMFSKHTFVGVVDEYRRLLCVQYDVKLFLVDYAAVCNDLFYQIGLSDFNNFGRILLQSETDLDIRSLLAKVYNDTHLLEISKLKQLPDIEDIISVLVKMTDMLKEYFSISLDTSDPNNPKLLTLPLLLKGYVPPLSKLPLFFFRIGTKVDWSNEKECLSGILKQIALLYIPESLPLIEDVPEESREEITEKHKTVSSLLEDVVFPVVKRRFLATTDSTRDVVEIANLPGLYKVFERC